MNAQTKSPGQLLGDNLIRAAYPLMDPDKLDPVERLQLLASVRDTVAETIGAEVGRMRTWGARGPQRWDSTTGRYTPATWSWAELADALGMSKSTCQRTYADVAPRERHR